MKKNIVLLLTLCISCMMLAGCGDSKQEIVMENVSETESIVEEISEVVSEEVSEEVSEPASEEVVEEIEYVNFSDIYQLEAYLKEFDRTTIVEFDFSEESPTQVIIPNNGKYTMQKSNVLQVLPNKEVTDIEYLSILPPFEGFSNWAVFIDTIGSDMEVSFTVIYADGTEEDFTIYVTVSE